MHSLQLKKRIHFTYLAFISDPKTNEFLVPLAPFSFSESNTIAVGPIIISWNKLYKHLVKD